MSVVWPRLGVAAANPLFAALATSDERVPATSHPVQIYAPVGGRRATEAEIANLRKRVLEVAVQHGFPAAIGRSGVVAFDRQVADVVRAAMPMTWAEAGARDVWTFVSLVVLPDVTRWRFGTGNVERWVASDLTRHTWARLWWQSVLFESDPDLLSALSESDLNALLERRRAIGGDPRLVVALGRAVVAASAGEVGRRELIRHVTARLGRRLAFIDLRALSDEQVVAFCRRLTAESTAHVSGSALQVSDSGV
jgi:hypothetical protein